MPIIFGREYLPKVWEDWSIRLSLFIYDKNTILVRVKFGSYIKDINCTMYLMIDSVKIKRERCGSGSEREK